MHIHARSKAVQSAVAQSTVQPRPAFANSDLEQHARKASLSALAAPKQALTASLSTLTKTGACQTGHFDRTGGAQASSISLSERTGGSGAGQSGHLERTSGAEAGSNSLFERTGGTGQAQTAFSSTFLSLFAPF